MRIIIFMCKTTVSAFLCIVCTNPVIYEVIIDTGTEDPKPFMNLLSVAMKEIICSLEPAS
jgi:hypothetical protein